METKDVSDATVDSLVTNTENPGQEKEGKKETVSYDTYQRAVRQLKKSKEQINELEGKINDIVAQETARKSELKAIEEQKLQEKGEYKKLLELEKKRNDELKQNLDVALQSKNEADKTIADTVKLHAFYEKLPGKIKRREYMNFVDLESIVIDPDTGSADKSSVDEAVNKFMEQYSDLVDTSHIGKLPAGRVNEFKSMNYDNWKNLKTADMKKNLKEIVQKKIQNLGG